MKDSSATPSGQGLFFVNSRIKRPDILSEEVFCKWYFEEHVPDVVATSGINSAWRYVDINKDALQPYLSLYRVDDLKFLWSDELYALPCDSKTLPGSGNCFDLAEFDVRMYAYVQGYKRADSKPGRTQALMVASMELGPNTTEEEFDRWYREEHFEAVSKIPGYQKSVCYKLAGSHQDRGDKPRTIPLPPAHLTLHEFDSAQIDNEAMKIASDTPTAKRILGDLKQMDVRVFEFKRGFGKFHAEFYDTKS